jgi:hypothetical protein
MPVFNDNFMNNAKLIPCLKQQKYCPKIIVTNHTSIYLFIHTSKFYIICDTAILFPRSLQNHAGFKVGLVFIFNIIKFYVSSLDYIDE